MWCSGAFLASSALNAFVAILLKTEDPGNDNTWRFSAAVLALHTLGLLQYLVPSGIFGYVQWACSAPLLSWLVSQLLATLPPGSGAPSHQRLLRCAMVEGALAVVGLALLFLVESPLVRLSVGFISITVLAIELLPFTTTTVLPYLIPALRGGGGATPASATTSAFVAGPAGGGGGGFGAHGLSGGNGGGRPTIPPRLSQRALHAGGGGGLGGAGLGAVGGSQQALTPPLDVLLNGMAAAKLLQAVSATAVSYISRGPGLSLLTCSSVTLPAALWSLSSAVALYSLPLAICMYYGVVRYAASMLVARRSALRRVSSLGLMAALEREREREREREDPVVLASGSQGRPTPGSGLLTSVRRIPPGASTGAAAAAAPAAAAAAVAAGGGADSDSESGLLGLPSRMLEVGDLYRITESSGHSISFSTSGDEGWRNDLALAQLLYMARTTFRGAGDRSSLEDSRTTPLEGGSSNSGGGSGGSGGSGGGLTTAAARSPRSASPPRGVVRTATTACQTDVCLTESLLGGSATAVAVAAAASPAAAAAAAAATATAAKSSAPLRAVAFAAAACLEFGVQCDLGPSTVIKEVRVEVPVPVPAPAPSDGGGGGALMTLLGALREHSSDIAHDMKNPLNGVLALSQNVLQGTFGELPTAATDQLGVVRACAYHLLNMINQLRDCLRMLHGGEPDGNCGKVQLSNAIEEVLKRMSPMVGSRLTIRAEHDPSLIVYADDGRLYQTVHTVLANAFKYTRKGGVTIETATSADKSAVTLRVLDTGAGFTPDQLEKFNSPLTGSPEEQLGLGLTMVKRTMAFFGGVLRLGNRTGGTSGGWVELTFRTAEDVPPLGAGLPPPPPQQQQATPAAAAAAAPPPAQSRELSKKLRKSVVGSERPAVDERLAAANSSTDTAPRSARTAGGGGGGGSSTARGGGGIAIGDEQLTAKGDELVRVLIVDDDPVNLTILEDLLRAEGYDVLTAASGTEALETYLTSDPQPKLVLLDVTLPDLTGHEVCLKMRSLTPGVPPPIIMISGKASTKDVIKGLQAGACDYITKPFQPQEVMARVETQLRLFMGEVAQLQEAAERNMALLRQILPPHILASLRGGTRVLVEKFSDAVVLCADVVGFSALAAAADTADCILTLNRLFSTFDALTDKMGVHKMDCHTDSYVAALGHMPQDRHMSNVMQVKLMLDLAREMLAAVDTLPYPDTLGKMQIRIGLHVGAVYGGVIGVKYPRYSLFGTTLRLAQGLQATALPNTIHVTEVVNNRVRAAGGETFTPYTTSQVQSLGIIRTYLLGGGPDCATGGPPAGMLDFSQLDNAVVVDYLRNATAAAHGITVLSCLLGTGAPAGGTAGGGGGGGVSGGGAAAAAAGAAATLGVIGAGSRAQLLQPGIARLPGSSGVTATAAAAGGGQGATAGAAAAPGAAAAAGCPAPLNIIPVISGKALSGGSGAAGADGGGGGRGVGGAGGGGGDTAMRASALTESRRESDDAASFAISLAQSIQQETAAQELMSAMAVVGSGDGSFMHSLDSTMPAGTLGSMAPTAPGGATSGGGLPITLGQMVPACGGSANAAMAGFSGSASTALAAAAAAAAAAGGGSGSSSLRRQVSDASLVQDLSPGPPAPGLTRMQRMHAPQTPLAPVAGSGAASPRHGGSRAGSRGPSRSASFRLGLPGPGGASPLAATVMQHQLLTALQQQQLAQQQQQLAQQQQQQYPQHAQLVAAAPATLGTIHGQLTPGSTLSIAEMSMLVADLDAGGGGSGVPSGASTSALQSTSEPLLKLPHSASADVGAAAAGRTGISSSTMRRIHLPLKAASIGALPGAEAAGGGGIGGGSALFPHMHGAGTSSFGGSASGGAMSTAGSLGSPPLFFSPGHTRADLSHQTPHHSAHGGAAAAAAATATAAFGPQQAAAALAAAAAAAATSPYAGLSDETRARLARLRTASQPDLQEAVAGLNAGGGIGGGGGGTTPSYTDSPHGVGHASFRQLPQGPLAAVRPALSVPPPQTQTRRAEPQRRPSTVGELLESLGLGHYARSISGAVVGGLSELATLDDTGLRRVGLMSSRSRQLVQDELRRWGFK